MNAESAVRFMGLALNQWALIVAMLIGLLGTFVTCVTLYLNFLKWAKLTVKAGKSAMPVFHDNALGFFR